VPTVVQKAIKKVPECKLLGEKPLRRFATVLVWDLSANYEHPAQNILDGPKQESKDPWPATVFLVSAPQSEQVGTYSISKQPAYREWVDVFVVQFRSASDEGKAVAQHTIVSLDPAKERAVRDVPQYGNPTPPLADWIGSLPTLPLSTAGGELLDADRDGDLAKVNALLNANPGLVASQDFDGTTPLCLAARYGHKDVAELLLANKAAVDSADYNGWTPLHFAALKGDREIAELLLANKADVNARESGKGKTPLHYAAAYGHKEVVELLLANKADINAKDIGGVSPLSDAESHQMNEVAKLLRQRGGRE
jgi:Ankyrin repeats (3 copies)/Ankyrin repeat